MSGLKDIAKGGWHPKGKDGKPSESWREDFKGVNQAGWVGKGKDTTRTQSAIDHVSQPLSSLKDPASFGPPPKNVNFHGGAALPNQVTPDRSGLGAPLTQAEIQAKKRRDELEATEREAEERRKAAPPLPYRADTTGLQTANLPPPPKKTDTVDGRGPQITPKPKPGLPPRLPPRQNTNPNLSRASPEPTHNIGLTSPPAHRGILNQGSLDRLGAAGISVPGFDIGKKSPLPPPGKSTTTAQTDSQESAQSATKFSSSVSNSQLNELQSRFSRLGTPSSKSDTSAQGTSFAQKQSALQTATAFRKDPTSVSLSDARNAASTANNFRERHGDQVAAGWKSANSLNQKYGLAEKATKFSNTTSNSFSTPVESSAHTGMETRDSNPVVKKAPPRPPPKKPELATAGAGPPPIPLASKPKLNTNNSAPAQKDYDLDLPSLWFAKSPPQFPPPSVNRLPGSRGATYKTGWSSSGARKTHFITGALRDNSTLITTLIHLTWDGNEPGLTVKAQQKHFPAPPPLSKQDQEHYRMKYSERIAAWCEARKGQQVGNGECWTLANDALVAIGNECRAKNEEPCTSSQSYVHGYLIYELIPPKPSNPPNGVLAAGVVRGDILQFLSAHFKRKDGMGESFAGAPDHTAVVTHVEPNGVLRTLEQNIGGVKIVKDGRYDLSEMVRGEVRVFRAVGEKWLKPLEATWP